MAFYLNLGYLALLISIITAFIMRRQLETFLLKLFPYFLLFVALIQVVAVEYSRPLPHKSNHWIFNLYNPVEFLFYGFLLLESIKNKTLRKISIALIAFYFLFALYNVLFLQGFWLFNHYSFVVGSFMVVCLCLLFYTETATSESNQWILRNRMFWIAGGIIILYICDFIIMGLLPVFMANPELGKASFEIIKYLNAAMYFLFTVSFLCKKFKPKQEAYPAG